MNRLIKYMGVAAMTSAIISGCSDDKEYFGAPPIKQPAPKEVYVQGTVKTAEGMPLADVAVSDGYDIVTTDADGRYSLKSEVPLGYMFVSTPDGYEPATFLDNNRPKFWQNVNKNAPSGVDFILKATDCKPLSIIAIADPQISDRAGDVELLKNMYVPQINRAIDSLKTAGTSPIVVTLGDIICDWFVANGFGYTLDRFNADFKVNAPVYHTMGNHDNDPFIEGDLASASTWHSHVGPSYYSFNRGGAHFIVTDNIVYTNPGAAPGVSGKRSYTTAYTKEQLQWIEKDLATIKDKTAPLFITMHGILLTYPEAEGVQVSKVYRFDDGGPQLGALLKDFTNVKVFSGHSHKNHFQHTPEGNIREYNYAGTNGGWWPAGYKPYKPNLPLCLDGTPWGMGIWNLSSGTAQHIFKGYELPVDHQIRAYDLNTLTVDDREFTSSYLPGNSANTNVVQANVWAWEPGCTVKMIENGRELAVKRVKMPDPYLITKYLVPIKKEYPKWDSGLNPESTAHMFRAQASTADSPVTIEFTDLSGRKFTTVLNRPAPAE
ncbi:calcineurin-like phosphoesterase family protein [uncultured Muribaculum sp.]|uniref:calcineurin-like phosphoesterase family protein n=1 Tax=uncultured Muribaculum sp. TaxID=1918613 RepID=UPI0025EF5C86|nr:calcineurin-like phosphoesterase family protein [uncultured Muribaculum sp.]